MVRERLKAQLQDDIQILNKQTKELQEVERNRMIRAVVREGVENIFNSKELDVDRKTILDSLIKKVA